MKALIPHLFTGGRLMLGTAALIAAIEGQLYVAATLVTLGAVTDGLDGFAARRLGVASPQVNPVRRSLRLGLVLDAPFAQRSSDQLGLSVATHRNGHPFLQGSTSKGTTLRHGETNVEFTWRFADTVASSE